MTTAPPPPLFEGFMSFTASAMSGVDHDVRDAVRYRWLLGQITELMKATHKLVLVELDAIIGASTLEEARAAVDRLRGPALAETFRAQGMCDAMNGLGDALAMVNERTRWGAADASQPLRDRLPQAESFAAVLSDREDRVAREYGTQIRELRDLLWGDTATDDLATIASRAAEAKTALTDQLSDFDELARRFKRVDSS